MKRKNTPLVAVALASFLGSSAVSQAAVIVAEDFSYSDGGLNGQNGGTGFSQAWQSTGLNVTSGVAVGNDNSRRDFTGNAFASSGTVWLSFDWGYDSNPTNGASYGGLTFYINGSETFLIGNTWPDPQPHNQWYMSGTGGSGVSNVGMKTGVAEITLGTGATSTVKLWVGTTGSPVDVSGAALLTTTTANLAGVNGLRINGGDFGNGGNNQSFDNLIIANSLADVDAAKPTWTNTSGGLWGTAGNWDKSLVAGGSGRAADFSTLNLTADTTVDLDSAVTIGNLTFGDTDTSSAAGWTLGNNGNAGNTLTMAGTTPTITVNTLGTAKAVTISAVVAGTDGLTKAGVGTLTLTGANTYTGTTNISDGTLQLQGTAFSTTARTYSIASGAVLNLDGDTGVAEGTTTFDGSGTLRITGGTFANESPNTPVGPGRNISVELDAGALIDVRSGAAMINGGWQSFTWTNNKADLNMDGSFNVWDGNTVFVDALTGAGTISGGGSQPFTVGVDNGSGTFSGVLSGNIGFTKNGTGTQTLSGAITYTGATTVNNGTLVVSGQSYFNVGRTTSIASGAVLELNNSNNTFTSLMPVSSITGAGTFRLSGDSTINQELGGDPNNTRLTFAMDSGGLIDLQGTSKLTNGGWKEMVWTTNKADMNIASGATFDIWDGLEVKIDALTGSGSVVKGHPDTNTFLLTVGVADGSGDFSGTIQNTSGGGALALTKTGTGTQTLSGTNNYNGATTVNGGMLNITGSTASGSAVTVGGASASGTPKLTGDGTINGAVTVKSAGGGAAGILSAGDSTTLSKVGTLAMGSSLTFESGSIFEWDINANKDGDGVGIDDGTAGTDFDNVTVTGAITVDSGAIFKVNFGTGVDMANAFWSTPFASQTWDIATIFGQALSGAFSTTVQTSTDVSSYGAFTINGSSLTWTAVPEPTSALAGLLLGAGLLRRRRRA